MVETDLVLTEPPMAIPQALWEGLFGRGFRTKEQLEKLFSPSLADLKNPKMLFGMDVACERLLRAFKNKEAVTIYADFDLDGTSGLALLYEGMKGLGYENLNYFQPKRLSEGYGLHPHLVEELAQKGTQVIITVDVGITAIEAAQTAKRCGIDLIITDHHLPYEELPEAYVIVNPNQKACTSGLGYLCGAGVAFYLLRNLKKEISENFKESPASGYNIKNVLDFFVIATLTDLVPLVEDNRVLVKHGLIKLSQTERPSLKRLMQELGLADRVLTSQEVAISLAPKLNALSRMEAEYLPRDVFLEKDPAKAAVIVDSVLKNQEIRKKYQNAAQLQALELKETMEQEGYVWVWSQDFHKGIIGLVATKLTELYRVPAFVGSINEKGEISGSSRIPEGTSFDLTKILEHGKDTLLKYGGHAQAAGFSLKAEYAYAFDESLKNYFKENPTVKTEKNIGFDAVATFEDISVQFMRWYQALEPFGKDFSPFSFKFENVKIAKIRKMNGGHLKFTLNQLNKELEAVVFSPGETYLSLKESDEISCIAEPKWNHFNGRRTLQLNLKQIL